MSMIPCQSADWRSETVVADDAALFTVIGAESTYGIQLLCSSLNNIQTATLTPQEVEVGEVNTVRLLHK